MIALGKISVKPGRNDPCPCGSNRKYKSCCGLLSTARPVPAAAAALDGGGNPRDSGAPVAMLNHDAVQEAQRLIDVADALRARGQPRQSLPLYRRALEIDPQSSVAHNCLGLMLAALGQRQLAAASYRQALTLNPRYVEALNNLGNVLRDLGQRREALPLYRQAIELDPRRAGSHYNLGNTLFELGELEAGAASF